MTEIERLHLENDAVILRALNYLLRDQLAARPSEGPVALQNAIVDQIEETRDSLPRDDSTAYPAARLGM
jgi:hypothetical protein